MDAIPAVRFDCGGLPRREWFDAFAERISLLIDALPTEGTRDHDSWSFSYRQVGELVFCEHVLGPMRSIRGRRHIQNGPANQLLVRFVKKGVVRQVLGEDRFELRGGEVHLFNLEVPFDSLQPLPVSSRSVFVPHERLGYDPSRHPAHMAFRTSQPTGAVLASALDAIGDQVGAVAAPEAERLGEGFAALVRSLALGEPLDEEECERVKAPWQRVVRGYIERHLHQPGFGVEQICRELGTSRASAYRLFAPDGGVNNYVMQRRLERAMRELSSTAPARGRVAQVAARWGFNDVSHFSRRFKSRFGISPGGAMNSGHGCPVTFDPNRLPIHDHKPLVCHTNWLDRMNRQQSRNNYL